MIKKSYNRQYYENLFYREGDHSQRNRQRLRLLLGYRQDGRLLEIGCGMGGFLRMVEPHFEVEGIDISKFAVAALREHFGERVRLGNVEQNILTANQYDVVVVFNILEHLRQPDRSLNRVFASLLPGGWMIGSVPLNGGIAGRVVTRLGNWIDRTHVSTFTPQVWERMFRRAGFRRIDFMGELNLGRNHCVYIQKPIWRQIAFNLIFVCQK